MMNVAPKIHVTDTDHRRLTELLDQLPPRDLAYAEGLEQELDRAVIVPAGAVPPDVVTMGSTVVYEDADSGRVMMLKLTWPEDANVEEGRVSVLAPVGAALLGLKVGSAISWPLPDGRTARLRVIQLIQDAP